MFLHLSVILVTGGGGLCLSMHHRSHDQGSLCPGGRGVSVWGISVMGGRLCPGGVSVQVGLCPGKVGLCPRVLSPRGSLSRGVSVRETPHMVTSGRYASY